MFHSPSEKKGVSPAKSVPSPSSQGRSPQSPGQGVRYITEDLVRKVSGQEHLPSLLSLNLTLSKQGGKKIKYIENLEKLKKLTTLNLSYNCIEKIEKLDRLALLKELNLSNNNISKIEGLETLKCLQILNLNGNSIQHIPPWLGKKLKALRVLKIAKNQLQSLHEFSKLRPLRDLGTLTVSENPVCLLSHCRLFLVFHITTLEILDSQIISQDERNNANERFSQVELERLEGELEQKEEQFNELKETHNQSLNELTAWGKKEKEALKVKSEQQQAIKELNRELGTKNDLLKRKTAELMVASQKHYELEQELAFYKIDHKFGALSKPPETDQGMTEGISSSDLFGESPYIGKGRFQKLHHAKRTSENQEFEEVGSIDSMSIDSDQRAQMHARLDAELMRKKDAVQDAQERLEILLRELSSTEKQLHQASNELQKVVAPGNQLTEDDKQEIRNQLSKKISKVQYLQGEVRKIEDSLNQTEAEIQDQEDEIGRLSGKMRRLGPKDASYGAIKKKIGDRERELSLNQNQYHALQDQLQSLLFTIAKETEDIKKLESELREGLAFHNDEMKTELEGIVDGLQTYLKNVTRKAEDQMRDVNKLKRDKAELLQCLKDFEADSKRADDQEGEISLLKERLALMEDSLMDQKDQNVNLLQRLDESRMKEEDDAELSAQLNDAHDEIEQLHRQLQSATDRAEAEQKGLHRELDIENKRLKAMKEKVKDLDLKEDEVRDLHHELSQLQHTNAHLQDQLFDMRQKLMEEKKKKNVNPDDLKRRLENVTKAIRTGTVMESPRSDDDDVDHALNSMQKKVVHQLNRTAHEAEEAQMQRNRAEDEANQLKEQVFQVQMNERKVAEQAIQAMVQQEKKAADKLKSDLDRLRRELDKTKNYALEKELEAARLREQMNEKSESSESPQTTARSMSTATEPVSTARTTSTDSTGTISTSQWPKKKQELYESMTQDEQDLFDELQEEIDELRRLLMNRDHKQASEKAIQAENLAKELKNLMDLRSQTTDSTSASSEVSTVKRRKVDAKIGHSSPSKPSRGEKALSDAMKEIERLKSHLNRVKPPDVPPVNLESKVDEIAQLQNALEEQQGEIQHLNKLIDHLTAPKPSNQAKDVPDGRPVPQFYPPSVHQSSHHQSSAHPSPQTSQPAIPNQSVPQPTQPIVAQSNANLQTDSVHQMPQVFSPQAQYTQPTLPIPDHGLPTAEGSTPVMVPQQVMSTPVDQHGRPIMMSTPIMVRESHLKGILKKRPSDPSLNISGIEHEQEMICTVPEHHDLEDYVSTLQKKVKKLKSQLKDAGFDSFLDESGRKVYFDEDSVDGRTVRHLQAELEERRIEMESLDLAVERQKRLLEKMREKERDILRQKNTSFRGLMHRQDRRRAFLHEDGDYDIYDSDYDYDYIPYRHPSRKNYLQEEILCLEKTLGKRRAELRESDRLLKECDEDLVTVRKEAKKTIEKYEAAKIGVNHSMKDAEEIERRAREAGRRLVEMEEEVEVMKDEVEEHREARQKEGEMLRDIQNVITAKDLEFQNIQAQIVQAQMQLDTLNTEAHEAANSHQNRIELIQDCGVTLEERHKELEELRQNIQREKIALDSVSKERQKEMNELETVQDSLHKRQQRLESFDRDSLDTFGSRTSRRKEAHDADTVGELKSLKSHLEGEIKQHETKLKKVREDISHEEEVLQNLAVMTNKQKADLHDIESTLTQKEEAIEKLTKDSKAKHTELHDLQNRLVEDNHTLDTIQMEVRRRSNELEHLQKRVENEQTEFDHLQKKSSNLSAILNGMKEEKAALESNHKEMTDKLASLKQTQKNVEASVKGQQQKLQRLDKQLRSVENAVHCVEGRRTELNQQVTSTATRVKESEEMLSDLQGNIGRAESNLESAEERLKEREENIADREKQISALDNQIDLKTKGQATSQQNILSLEERIGNLGHEIKSRDRDKSDLAIALERSLKELNDIKAQFSHDIEAKSSEVDELHTHLSALNQNLEERSQELQYYREKSANEIADLESVAQAHYSRANRLSEELEFLRSEHSDLRAQVVAQKEQADKEKTLEDALLTFKQDIKEELNSNLKGIEKSRSEAAQEAEQLNSQKLSIEDHLHKLKLSLNMIRSGQPNMNIFVGSKNSSDHNFAEQQAFLKNQLQQKMSRHVESMRNQQELSQNSIQHLQEKLKNLEKTMSVAESSIYQQKFSSQMPPNQDPDSNKERVKSTGESLVAPSAEESSQPPCPPSPVLSKSPKRAYSPHRHSAHRKLRSPNITDS